MEKIAALHQNKQGESVKNVGAKDSKTVLGAKVCQCTSSCLKSKQCCCMALGKLCSTKCHGKRKEVHYENCYHHHNGLIFFLIL